MQSVVIPKTPLWQMHGWEQIAFDWKPKNMNQLLQRFEMVDNLMADILRQKSEAERLRIASRMWKSARVMLQGVKRLEHPA